MLSLFEYGPVKLSSGKMSDFKINCDALTFDELSALAKMAQPLVAPYGTVIGVPTGGTAFAEHLRRFSTEDAPRLIVDDVMTTGASISEYYELESKGLVIFSRDKLILEGMTWVRAMFSTSLKQ